MTTVTSEALDATRQQVRQMLSDSPAFRALPLESQREIARNTVDVASYLAEPEGLRIGAPGLAGLPTLAPEPATADALATSTETTTSSGQNTDSAGHFTAQGAQQGAAAAGSLLQAVNFPTFVASLVQGVFHAIVQSSIEQMEAYGKLVADVAKTLDQFRDENVSPNQGRDHLVQQFPDIFEIGSDDADDPFGGMGMGMGGGGGGGGPRINVRDGVDEQDALARVNSLPIEGGPLKSLDSDSAEQHLVPAARTQLATSRQQLLATMVLMGINRIVVTDGKIQAKVLYDFQAHDDFRFAQSATKYDYGDKYSTQMASETSTQPADQGSSPPPQTSNRDASYYSSGRYRYESKPVMTLASATNEIGNATLGTKASLAGIVDINFKSDYLPLEKMADSFQIAQLQQAAKPGAPVALPAAAPSPSTPPATGGAAPAAPAAASAGATHP